MTEKQIKACPNPWCESTTGPIRLTPDSGKGEQRMCYECGVRGPVGATEAEAVELWNQRPTDDLVEHLVEAVQMYINLRNGVRGSWDDCVLLMLRTLQQANDAGYGDTRRWNG